uniref:peroxidase 4-like isoform X2 n=1 Tax=Fragaria vesca subsp. vesca TaxID=101020 RepID=UPI0005C977E7|nr:PREDICTED: peroxidase 4-like isoform X2 [Fragaria vesca subsp. vesca]
MVSYKLLLLGLVFAGAVLQSINGKLSPTSYLPRCPNALSIVQDEVIAAIKNERRIGASLLRLHFHDCFVNVSTTSEVYPSFIHLHLSSDVLKFCTWGFLEKFQGCDASVLLDDTPGFIGEKTAVPNNNSLGGFEVVDRIKAKVEKACPGVVSCADILALAARDSLGGPSWQVYLGRRDSTSASRSAASTSIPPPASNISSLLSSFAAQGLSLRDLVALSGSHTIGLARCTSFRARIYKDTTTDAVFAKSLQSNCPVTGNDNNLASLDLQTPTYFDNLYYKNLLKEKGLLHSDQELFNGTPADAMVKLYASNTFAFFYDFANSMVKMGNIKPLTGSQGEIRINCRKVN